MIFVGFSTGTDPDQVDAQEALAKKFNDSQESIEVDAAYESARTGKVVEIR